MERRPNPIETGRGVVALDLGGVCINIDPLSCARRLGMKVQKVSDIPKNFMELQLAFETGLVSSEKWIEDFYVLMCGRADRKKIVEAFRSILLADVEGMAALARHITMEDGRRIIAFSNISTLHADDFTLKCTFSHLFTGGVYSFEAGTMKPEPGIYEFFERRHGRPVAYFDDRPENVDAALRRGWPAFLFTNASNARRDYFAACAGASDTSPT